MENDLKTALENAHKDAIMADKIFIAALAKQFPRKKFLGDVRYQTDIFNKETKIAADNYHLSVEKCRIAANEYYAKLYGGSK